ERMQQVAEIRKFALGGKMRRMRQFRKRRYRVHRRVEDELRPLCWARVFQWLCLQTAGNDQLSRVSDQGKRRGTRLEWPQPGGGIKLILHVGVAVTRAAHKRCAADYVSAS